MQQSIEVVIPVHDVNRPLQRAIDSVLAQSEDLKGRSTSLLITVVAHNIEIATLQSHLRQETLASGQITWLQHNDNLRSPSGPRNAALDASVATFLSFLDSDDYLENGSLPAWLDAAKANDASAVIAPLRTPENTILHSPRIRSNKPKILDPLKDGLAYRSVPYGLLRRSSLAESNFRYAEGIGTGEDLATTLKLWFESGPIVYPYGAPAYCQTDDSGAGRVTSSVLSIADEFRWLESVISSNWLEKSPRKISSSVALKLMRVHGVGALRRRGQLALSASSPELGNDVEPAQHGVKLWSVAERDSWAGVFRTLRELSRNNLAALSQRDWQLAQAAAEASTEAQLAAAVVRHESSGRAGELLTHNLASVFARESTLRHYLAERARMKSKIF